MFINSPINLASFILCLFFYGFLLIKFIFNFIKYVDWPQVNQGENFKIVVLGQSDVIDALKKIAEPLCHIGKRTRFDHLAFFHPQTAHHTRLHANVDADYIGQWGWCRHRKGRW